MSGLTDESEPFFGAVVSEAAKTLSAYLGHMPGPTLPASA